LTVSSATTTIATGSTSASINLTQSFLGTNSDTMSVVASLLSAPTGNAVMPVLTNVLGSTVGGYVSNISSDNLAGQITDSAPVGTYAIATAVYKVTFAPTKPGTYVLSFKAQNGTYTSPTTVAVQAPAVTWTVTVPSETLADATSTLTTRAAGVTTGSTTTVSVAGAGSATVVATVEVTVTDSTEDIVGVTIEAFANVAFKESVPAPPAKTSVVLSV
jgi:hypothetical protein